MKTDLWRKRRSGIVARSPRFHCTKPKAIVRSANPTKSPITLEELQENDVPPQCSARRRQQTAAMISVIPGRSRERNLCWTDVFRWEPLAFMRRKSKTRKNDAPPIGRLLSQIISNCHGTKLLTLTSRNTTSKKHDLSRCPLMEVPSKLRFQIRSKRSQDTWAAFRA